MGWTLDTLQLPGGTTGHKGVQWNVVFRLSKDWILANIRLGPQVSVSEACTGVAGPLRVLKGYIDLWPLHVQFTPHTFLAFAVPPLHRLWARISLSTWPGLWGKWGTWREQMVPPEQTRCCLSQDSPGLLWWNQSLRDRASSGKSGQSWSTLGLILPFCEPFLMLSTSQPILSLPLQQNPHLFPLYTQSHIAYSEGFSCAHLPSWETLHSTQPDQALAMAQGCSGTLPFRLL